MPITLSNTSISGIGVGGLGSEVVTSALIATNTINRDRFAANAIPTYLVVQRSSAQSLGGDSGWNNHLTLTFSTTFSTRCLFTYYTSNGWESGACFGYARFILNGSKIGQNFMVGKQTANNGAGAGCGVWFADVGAGTHTITAQHRNTGGGSTWQSPFFSADGEAGNTLGVWYYA
jgi:hypothetical protein